MRFREMVTGEEQAVLDLVMRVFDEFVRLRTPSDGPGTGLGLAVARGLTEAHGGTVTCRDTPGGGATFVVSLPIAREALETGT